MKSAVETVSPTRVRLTVEVPFEELKPSVDAAYKKLAGQVRIKGFRPGKVPPRIIDQQVGRGAVLEEAINTAIPRLYGEAVQEHEVAIIGHPDLEVTRFDDGEALAFTAEVDVRPEVELPAYDALTVTVDDVTVSDAEVDEQLSSLRDRFATLSGVDRPVEAGDYVSIDLAATVDGAELPDASATGLSYAVGSGDLVAGLDDELVGTREGETKTFTTELVAGEHAGQAAEVTVTVKSVKAKEVPELDDDFAQTASEFDTIEELRADIRSRMERVRRLEQGMQARDRALEALLELVDVPLPESIVQAEIDWRQQSLQQQLDQADLRREDYLESEGRTDEEFDAEIADGARQAVKAQFVLDAIADKEELGINEGELTEQVVRRAQRAGVSPDVYAQQLVQAGQLQALVAEVRRGKALALVLDGATISDASGNKVDLSELREDTGPVSPAAAAAEDAVEVIEDTELVEASELAEE